MKIILAIAKNTFKQAIRDKILYGIIIFALLFIGSVAIISSLALEENVFVMRNLGLAGIYFFGLIVTIFLGSSLIYDEVDQRTTYMLLAKPVTRGNIVIGKFLGLLASTGLTTILMTAAYAAIIFFNGGGVDFQVLIVVGLQLIEMALLITVLILFSTITTPLASTIYTILIVYIGHSLSLIYSYAMKANYLTKVTLLAVYYIAPNLEKFNSRNLIAHNLPLSARELALSSIYALGYIILVLYMANIAFNKRDL
jgi:Cu-processing system permease protein